ncbi:hypothetical protein ACXGQW_11620 [Wenyingzhuangia sp. IMCC45533]
MPKEIVVGDNNTDVVVVTSFKMHDIDINLNMEYCLHLFIYDVRGKIDPSIIVSNWDESYSVSIETAMDAKDDYLGTASVIFKADRKEITIKTPIALKLGSLGKGTTYFTRKLDVFAMATPAIGRISRRSGPYEAQVTY